MAGPGWPCSHNFTGFISSKCPQYPPLVFLPLTIFLKQRIWVSLSQIHPAQLLRGLEPQLLCSRSFFKDLVQEGDASKERDGSRAGPFTRLLQPLPGFSVLSPATQPLILHPKPLTCPRAPWPHDLSFMPTYVPRGFPRHPLLHPPCLAHTSTKAPSTKVILYLYEMVLDFQGQLKHCSSMFLLSGYIILYTNYHL